MTVSPLRLVLCVLTGILTAVALLLLLTGCIGPAIPTGIWAFLLIIGLVFERWRYKPLAGRAPGLGWNATDERFLDPETGKMVTVYFNAATGERRYVAG